jgi:hypothetical protein
VLEEAVGLGQAQTTEQGNLPHLTQVLAVVVRLMPPLVRMYLLVQVVLA